MSDQQVVIYRAANLQQAYVLKNLLEGEQIQATIWNEAIQGALGELPVGTSTAPQVVVRQQDADIARQIALAFDGARDYAGPQVIDAEDAWPHCPTCNSPRMATCPGCDNMSANFEAAFHPAGFDDVPSEDDGSGDGEVIRHVCPVCAEPVVAVRHRYCTECGHDYGDGVVVELPPDDVGEGNPFRTFTLFAGLCVLAALSPWILLVRVRLTCPLTANQHNRQALHGT